MNNVVIYRLGELLNKYHIKMIYISPHAGASITRLKVQRLEFFSRRISLIKMSAPSFTGSRKSYSTSNEQKLFPCILLVWGHHRPTERSFHPSSRRTLLSHPTGERVRYKQARVEWSGGYAARATLVRGRKSIK